MRALILPRKALSAYDKRLAALEGKAYEYASGRIGAFIEKFPGATPEQVREFAIEVVDDAVGAFGDGASSLAADMYEGMAELSGVKVKPAVIDTSDVHSHIESEVRYQLGKFLSGDPQGFIHACGSKASDQVARRANQTMRLNAKRDGLRYARVPMGGETCSFCAMLASRGFDYRSAKTAGEGNHYHKNCRCKVIPGFEGMEVEGYDEDEWYNRWIAFKEIDDAPGLSVKARQSAKEFLSTVPMTDDGEITRAVSVALARAEADTYNERMNRAWQRFRKDKTPQNYSDAVGAYLDSVGYSHNVPLAAEFMSKPDGDEIWAVLKIGDPAFFLYAGTDHKYPDYESGGALFEIKTPKSRKKIRRLMREASEKFDEYPSKSKNCVLSILRVPESREDAFVAARDFVADGTFDSVTVIDVDGSVHVIEEGTLRLGS